MDDSVPHLRGMQWCRCTRSVLKPCAHDLWYTKKIDDCVLHMEGMQGCRCTCSVLKLCGNHFCTAHRNPVLMDAGARAPLDLPAVIRTGDP